MGRRSAIGFIAQALALFVLGAAILGLLTCASTPPPKPTCEPVLVPQMRRCQLPEGPTLHPLQSLPSCPTGLTDGLCFDRPGAAALADRIDTLQRWIIDAKRQCSSEVILQRDLGLAIRDGGVDGARPPR